MNGMGYTVDRFAFARYSWHCDIRDYLDSFALQLQNWYTLGQTNPYGKARYRLKNTIRHRVFAEEHRQVFLVPV